MRTRKSTIIAAMAAAATGLGLAGPANAASTAGEVSAQAASGGKRMYVAHSTYGEPSCLIVPRYTGGKKMRARTLTKDLTGEKYVQRLTLRKVKKNTYKTKNSYGDVYRFRFYTKKVRAKNWPLGGYTAPLYRANKCTYGTPIPD